MELALMIAKSCWCDEETKDLERDDALVNAVAKRIAIWVETATQNHENTMFYRGLVERCGKAIGERAFTQDDGNICEDVLCIKVPEIIEYDYKKNRR